MISARCSLFSVVRYASELSKKQYCRRHSISIHVNNAVFLPISGPQVTRSGKNKSAVPRYSAKMASTSSESSKGLNKTTGKGRNRLALEKSPYLLQHATNPVDWYPWSDEALEKAKREDKMIFLSIGYSTCHWCHVMERESFENPEIAKIMNDNYVNIKVDREERPDIDRTYMTYVQVVSGHGGWPLSCFLAPDLTPILGSTYFPPEDKYGRPGFKSILLDIASKWKERKQEILSSSKNLFSALQQSVQSSHKPQASRDVLPPVECGDLCVQQLAKSYEPRFGGFTGAPKFPQPVNINFLLHMYARNRGGQPNEECREMAVYTLEKMANGGIHDHVGQGFARYSVDREWHVPHFEKMLYDQAQLMQAYANAYIVTEQDQFKEVVDDIATYITRDLRHKEGGFYSAEDADSLPTGDSKEKKEGAYYVWKYDEIKMLLGKDIPGGQKHTLCDLFCFHYSIKPEGNVSKHKDPHCEFEGKNVLIAYGSVEETARRFDLTPESTKAHLKEACKILYEARLKRPRPHLDDKIVTAWNGLMITGLSRAACATNNQHYASLASDCARFVERHLFDKTKRVLLRSCYRGDRDAIVQSSVPINGFHVDYAFVVRGLLDLYEASFDDHWLELAEELQNVQDELFWDDEGDDYYASARDDPSVILRLKDYHDGAEPSSNSVACGNLLKLAAYLDRNDLKDKAERMLKSLSATLARDPANCPELALALVHCHDSTTQVCVVGRRDDERTRDLVRVVHESLVVGKVVILIDPEQPDNVITRKNTVVGHMKPAGNRPTAYVCRHRTCSLPVTNPEELAALLKRVD